MSRDEFIQHNVHLRKLNQPFEWHSQGPGSNPDEVVEKNSGSNNDTTENTKKKPSTCRNSVQGKLWIADDQGKTFLKCIGIQMKMVQANLKLKNFRFR